MIEVVLLKLSGLRVNEVVTSLKLIDAIVILYGHDACVQFTKYINYLVGKVFEDQPVVIFVAFIPKQSAVITVYFLHSLSKVILVDLDYFTQLIPTPDKFLQFMAIWLSKVFQFM